MTRKFLTKAFGRWAKSQNLTEIALLHLARDMENGLVDASLGGGLFKQRVPIGNRSKRDGGRAILAVKHQYAVFYLYGFLKSERSNINGLEARALKVLAKQLLSYTEKEIDMAVVVGELIEIGGS